MSLARRGRGTRSSRKSTPSQRQRRPWQAPSATRLPSPPDQIRRGASARMTAAAPPTWSTSAWLRISRSRGRRPSLDRLGTTTPAPVSSPTGCAGPASNSSRWRRVSTTTALPCPTSRAVTRNAPQGMAVPAGARNSRTASPTAGRCRRATPSHNRTVPVLSQRQCAASGRDRGRLDRGESVDPADGQGHGSVGDRQDGPRRRPPTPGSAPAPGTGPGRPPAPPAARPAGWPARTARARSR